MKVRDLTRYWWASAGGGVSGNVIKRLALLTDLAESSYSSASRIALPNDEFGGLDPFDVASFLARHALPVAAPKLIP
jgi:hypothetical protein